MKNDQFDDLEGPAHRILFDEDENDLTPEQRQQRQRAKQKPTIPAENSTDDQEPRP